MQEGGSRIGFSELTGVPITRSKIRLVFRILAPFLAFFLLPRLVGAEIYAAFVLSFFFFTSAIGLLTSPLEHALIRLRSKPGYGPKFVQIFWAYLAIAIAASFVAGMTYNLFPTKFQTVTATSMTALVAVATAAVASQVGYFLKFLRSDWYYYYAEILNYALIALVVLVVKSWGSLNFLIFSCLSSLTYLGLVAIRLLQMSKQVTIAPPQPRRIGSLLLRAFRASTLPSLFGALVKRADSFYMPVMEFSPVAVLVYRLIRNVIASVSLVGNMHAQDIWMTRRISKKVSSPAAYVLITISMMIVLTSVVWLYLEWLGVSNPLQPSDLGCIGVSTAAAVYLSLNAAEINRVFQQGRYDIVLKGSLISLTSFLTLLVLGKLNHLDVVTYLLILVYIPQLANGLYIRKTN